MRRVLLFYFSERAAWRGGVALPDFLLCPLFPVQQITSSGIGHRVKYFFRVGNQYDDDGGLLPDILLLTQATIFVWFDGTLIVYYYYPFNYVLHCLLFCYVWWLCMAINVSYSITVGFSPTLVLTQGYYHHRGTLFNAT